MALAGNHQDHNIQIFKDNLLEELQEKGMKLVNLFPVSMDKAELVNVDKLGKSTSVIKTTRGQAKVFTEPTFERRTISFVPVTSDQFVDVTDINNFGVDPQSKLVKSMAEEIGRQADLVVMDAISGSANVITAGSTAATAIPSASKVAVGSYAFHGGTTAYTGAICLTPSKLKEARKVIGTNFGNINRLVVIGNMNQFESLLSFDDVKNGGWYRGGKDVLDNNTFSALEGFLGMSYVQYEATPAISSTVDAVYVVERDKALQISIRTPLTVELGKLMDRVMNPTAIAVWMDLGATRMYEELVIQIACSPTVRVPS